MSFSGSYHLRYKPFAFKCEFPLEEQFVDYNNWLLKPRVNGVYIPMFYTAQQSKLILEIRY